MGKPTGFMEYERLDRSYKPAGDRVQHFREFVIPLDDSELRNQGARCMDCGIPFCHQGCPVNNIIPDWNDLVYQGNWQEASRPAVDQQLSRIHRPHLPGTCEAACTLNIDDRPVTIKTIECAIVDKAWENNWITPQIADTRPASGRRSRLRSGRPGLCPAAGTRRARGRVFEKSDRIGGLLRYGIPDFKMEKHIIDRRMGQMQAEGVNFHTEVHIGQQAGANCSGTTTPSR